MDAFPMNAQVVLYRKREKKGRILLMGLIVGAAFPIILAKIHDSSSFGAAFPLVNWANVPPARDAAMEQFFAQFDRVVKWVTFQY